MSTTDTRAAFEVAVCEIVPRPLFLLNADGNYQEIMVQGFYSLWNAAIAHASHTPKEVSGQGCALCGNWIGHDLECKNHPVNAATEAAKATGTAGELPPLIGMEVSMDVSTGDEDFDHRIFGRIEGLMAKGDGTDIILAVEESRNFAADTQAARQPAPVVDDEAPKRVIDYITAFDKRLIGRGFDHAQRMEIVGLLVSKETQDAALAATAAPVVDIEQLIGIIRSFGYTTYSQSREIAEALAARSQP